MDIISKGKNQEESKGTVRFSCKNCECVWDADKDEYFIESDTNALKSSQIVHANCPNCYKICEAFKQRIYSPSVSCSTSAQYPSTQTSIGKTESSRC